MQQKLFKPSERAKKATDAKVAVTDAVNGPKKTPQEVSICGTAELPGNPYPMELQAVC